MLEWVRDHPVLLTGLFIASAVVFVGSLVAAPLIVARIPADYFTHERRPPGRWVSAHPALRITLRVLKNSLGALLMLAGLAMLVTPGQGLLTLIAGFLLIDFPRKYRLERWLVSRRSVHAAINWMRRRSGKPPLGLPVDGSLGRDVSREDNR